MKVQGFGDGEFVQNMLLPNYVAISNQMRPYRNAPPEIFEMIKNQVIGIQGWPVSIIYPDALLLETIELTGTKSKIKSAKRVVPNPML